MSEIIYEMPTSKKFKNLSGQVFGRLSVLEWNHKVKHDNGNQFQYYLCRCECGNETIVAASSLARGDTKSCGCYRKDWIIGKSTTHGLTNHPLYDRCDKILSRCYNHNHESFHYYGGREQSLPIYVQESWLNDIGLMIREIEAEIGLPPFKKAQIDRKENHLGYESGNLRWVTPEENSRNKRDTHNHASDPVTKKPTRTYAAWQNLLQRHGDEVCTEWRGDGNCETTNGFKNFLNDMGEKPYLGYKKKTPLKRHDETKPWCKENCYWKVT